MPNLRDLSEFIDQNKNFVVTMVIIFSAIYFTIYITELSSKWVDAALYAAGVYSGHKIEKVKSSMRSTK
jgi:uncharacterized membrane protein (DUF485 family)